MIIIFDVIVNKYDIRILFFFGFLGVKCFIVVIFIVINRKFS